MRPREEQTWAVLGEAALRASERPIVTALNPRVGPEGLCHVRCFVPNDQMLHILQIVDEFPRVRV